MLVGNGWYEQIMHFTFFQKLTCAPDTEHNVGPLNGSLSEH